jgi:hypothetical protein
MAIEVLQLGQFVNLTRDDYGAGAYVNGGDT